MDIKSRTRSDVLVVDGIARLSGTLRIDSLGYRPRAGDRIPLLKARKIVGRFTAVKTSLPGRYTVEFVKEGGIGYLVVGPFPPNRHPLSPRLRSK